MTTTVQELQSSKASVTISLKTLTHLGKAEGDDRPSVRIKNKALQQMKALVAASDKEVAWHGIVTKENNSYIIHQVLVYPQKVTSATVESDDDAYPIWLNKLSDYNFEHLRMQGHSHVNMSVSPSGVDEGFYETLIKHINDYYIFIIMNKQNKIWINLYDLAADIAYDTDDIDITYDGFSYKAWAEVQLTANIVKPEPPKETKQKAVKYAYYKPTFKSSKPMSSEEIYESYLANAQRRMNL